MEKSTIIQHIAWLLAMIFAVACATPSANTPAPTASPEPTATLKPAPTAIIITPLPLPTTIPQQAVRLEEAIKKRRKSVTVDFVIDVNELKDGVTPAQLAYGDNWYKYTSPDGAFSVLMRGSFGPRESAYTATIGDSHGVVKVVEAAYLLSERQIVSAFEVPSIVGGEVTPERFLDSLDPAALAGRTGPDPFSPTESNPITITKIIIDVDNRIQLNGIPGREWIIRGAVNDDPKLTPPIHVRVYVVGSTVYQLTFGGTLPDANETGEQFLNSFTLHHSAQ